MRGATAALVGWWAAAATAAMPAVGPERAFPELKVYDAAGHPWRAAREDWTQAREKIRQDPNWTAWLQREQGQVDAWIAHHRDRVEWAAGWSHDGVSPKDGSRVQWIDRVPREEQTEFSSPSDPHIAITDKLFAWWVVGFREKHLDIMVRAARLARLTGEGRYVDWDRSQMDFYADQLANFRRLPTAQAPLYWQTLDEAVCLAKYAEVVRLLGDRVDPGQRGRWRRTFFDPEVALLERTFRQIHNIAAWQRSAAAQVALLFGDETMWHRAIDGPFGIRAQMAVGITHDYLWYEQSLGYNSYVVSAVQGLFVMAGIAGRAAELAPEMAAAENLLLSPIYLRFPDGQLPNPADNNGIPHAPDRAALAADYRVFPTLLGLQEAAGRRDWNTLLDPPPPASRPGALPEVTSRNLEATRMALLKVGPWQVFFHYGQLTRSHSQAEALNYSAFYRDIDISHDPGTVGYGSPLHRNYYQRGLNHNVPLVDGEGETPPQRGELLAYSAADGGVAAVQPQFQPGVRAERALRIEDNRLIDSLSVESSAKARRLGFALHLQGKVRLPGNFAADPSFAHDRPAPFGYWREVTAANFSDRAEFDVVYGSAVMHVALTAPGSFRLWHASSPDLPPRRRESFYLELVQPAKQAKFTTTFTPR